MHLFSAYLTSLASAALLEEQGPQDHLWVAEVPYGRVCMHLFSAYLTSLASAALLEELEPQDHLWVAEVPYGRVCMHLFSAYLTSLASAALLEELEPISGQLKYHMAGYPLILCIPDFIGFSGTTGRAGATGSSVGS
jgi:hypothetical protein